MLPGTHKDSNPSPLHPSLPTALQVLLGKEIGWGLGDTDQHEEEDEGHNVGQVWHRLQDDPDDLG